MTRHAASSCAVAREAGRDEAVVVGPDRAVVVADRVVGGHLRRHGTNPPAGEEVGGGEALAQRCGAAVRDRAGPEQVAGIRGHAVDLPSPPVEAHRIRACLGHPEGGLDRLGQRRRGECAGAAAPASSPSAARIAAQPSRAATTYPCTSTAAIGGVGDAAIGEAVAVVAVLPDLVADPAAMRGRYQMSPSSSAVASIQAIAARDCGQDRRPASPASVRGSCSAGPAAIPMQPRAASRPSARRGGRGGRRAASRRPSRSSGHAAHARGPPARRCAPRAGSCRAALRGTGRRACPGTPPAGGACRRPARRGRGASSASR